MVLIKNSFYTGGIFLDLYSVDYDDNLITTVPDPYINKI